MMRILFRLVMSLGLLLLPGRLGAQSVEDVDLHEAPEAGEVQVTATMLSQAITDIRSELAAGVREVNVRSLNPSELIAFFDPDPTKNPLMQLAPDLKKPGQRVDFRLAGARFRVQMADSGELRVRMRDVDLSNLTSEARTNLIKALNASFGRVEIRGFDPAGNRIRLEVRDGLVKKDEVKADRSGRGREGTSADINDEHARDRGRDLDHSDHSIRGRDRASLERDRVERSGRPERMERHERHGKH